MVFGGFKWLLFLLFSNVFFSQKSLNWETQLYASTDVLVAHPNEVHVQKTKTIEQQFYHSTLPKKKEDYLALVILLCNRGYVQRQLGATQEATESYETAWKSFEAKKLDRYDIVEFCLKPLGNLYLHAGEYTLAENTIKQYYFIAEQQKNEDHLLSAILNLSVVYQNTGQQQRAIKILEDTLLDGRWKTDQKVQLWNNLATNYMLLGELFKAKKHLNALISYASDSNTKFHAIRNLAQIAGQEARFVSAFQFWEQAYKISDTHSAITTREKAKMWYERAKLCYLNHDSKQALLDIQTSFKLLLPKEAKEVSFPKKEPTYLETLFVDLFDLQALVYVQLGKSQAALKAFEQAFQLEEDLMFSLNFEQNQILFQTERHQRVEHCLAIYFEAYEKSRQQHWIDQAFLLVENQKSKVLMENQHYYRKISKEEKIAKQKLNRLSLVIEQEQLKGIEANINRIHSWVQEQNRIVFELKKTQKEKVNSPVLSLSNLNKVLQKQDIGLLSFFIGNENAYQFQWLNGKLNYVSLGNSALLNTRIRNYLRYFENSERILQDVVGFQKESFELYKRLKIKSISSEHLLIAPDGLLRLLPFESLVTKVTPTTSFAKIPFLLQQANVFSMHSVASLHNQSVTVQPLRVFGVFPVFKNTPSELVFSINEKEQIAKYSKGTFLLEQEATYKNFVQQASQFSVLHLSTHATSGDSETSASIQFSDRTVYYQELYGLNLKPDLLVLSACETGLGKWFVGESPLTVARGFQMAGSTNQVFSLWKVNDFTTSKLMAFFYSQLAHKIGYPQALQLAKKAYLEDVTISNSKKSPYYWSAFQYYGRPVIVKKGLNPIVLWTCFFSFLFLVRLLYRRWK